MTESNNTPNNKVYNMDDTLDINELAALNDDISPEFIEQLQSKVSKKADKFSDTQPQAPSDDSELFEEIPQPESQSQTPTEETAVTEGSAPINVNIDENVDDNFIKKYKAKLNKQQQNKDTEPEDTTLMARSVPKIADKPQEEDKAESVAETENAQSAEPTAEVQQNETAEAENPSEQPADTENKEIENLTSGNIVEKPLTEEQKNYNDSLDMLDDNVKYTKYVIYIDPENKEFIDSLTVKERKNLINRIIREQDDVAITKRRFSSVQTIIRHTIVALITIAIAIPFIYKVINVSLEASINNYRQSQSLFQVLYKEHGKIKTNK